MISIEMPNGRVYELAGTISGSSGNVNFIPEMDLSDELIERLESAYNQKELFFQDHILFNDDNIDEDLLEELQQHLGLEDFSEPIRVLALKEFLQEEDIREIDEKSYDAYEYGKDEYLVLTDDEAEEKAKENVQDYLNDAGFEGFTDFAQSYAMDNFVDTDWFDDVMKESHESIAYDYQQETPSDPDTYVNELHSEMVSDGIMNEPDYPEEPEESDYEYEKEEFTDSSEFDSIQSEEPDSDDESYSDWEDELETARTEWDDEQDRLEEEAKEEYDEAFEEWESEVQEYRSELESDVENNIEEYVESLADEDSVEWYKINFGELNEVVKNNNLLDEDAFCEWIIETDGRGRLATYDGEENEETVTYQNDTETFYIYRTD